MDCDLTWPSRPFRHRVAQFLFQMHLTLFLASIALYRLPHLPPVSQSSNPSVSSPMSATLAQSMLQMCAVHYVYMRICCVCQRRVGGRLNAGVSGVNPISGPNVAMYRIQIAMLPCCHLAMVPCCHVAMYYCTESRFQMPRAFIVPFPFYAVVYQPPVLHKGLTFGSNDHQSFSPLHFLTASNINCTYLKCDFMQGNLLLICEPVLVFYTV